MTTDLYMHVIIESTMDERITESVPQSTAQGVADKWEAQGYGVSIVPCSCHSDTGCANFTEFHPDDVLTQAT